MGDTGRNKSKIRKHLPQAPDFGDHLSEIKHLSSRTRFLPSLVLPLTLQNECRPPFHPTHRGRGKFTTWPPPPPAQTGPAPPRLFPIPLHPQHPPAFKDRPPNGSQPHHKRSKSKSAVQGSTGFKHDPRDTRASISLSPTTCEDGSLFYDGVNVTPIQQKLYFER